MSQQLNLLNKERHAANPLILALGIWGSILLVLVAAWGVNQLRLSAARENEVATAKKLGDARVIIKQREDALAAITADIAALQPLDAAAKQLQDLADGLGTTSGYAPHFNTLADATESGLWLTAVDIQRGGKTIKVEGQSLNNDTILHFGRTLNGAFADRGVSFTTLEMKPEALAPAGTHGAALKSTRFTIQ